MSNEYWLLPFAGLLLFSGFVVSIITALATVDWRYLIISVICYMLIAAR